MSENPARGRTRGGGRGGTSRGGGSARGGSSRGGSSRGRGGSARDATRHSARDDAEITSLDSRCIAEAPAPGSTEVAAEEFSSLALSRATLSGLTRARFTRMTAIQRAAIPHACAGRDVLGAAKTGSGKTLAFIIPLLERLYRARWSAGAGLGAAVISPTRELAMQTFEVLRSVGVAHSVISAGLLTGGRDFAEESAIVDSLAVVVATPGRLLQHLEQSPGFDASGLLVLVLDEADRLLDMGFSEALNAILSYLPRSPARQTLLFSATQTRSVRDLARLSLNAPEYVAVHDDAAAATPARLSQHYVVARAADKINLLWSFLRTHLTQKIIVFVSSCKEARFLFEAFRRLRPGLPLQVLHGKMKQQRRMLVYYDYVKKPAAALFATDIAARGLDFPSVDWVLQLDAPEDAAAYIHRVGRTARFKSKGHALLVLSPREATGLVPLLEAARVPIQQTHIAPNAALSVTGKLAAEIAADAELKSLAQGAFVAYVRSVALQTNKSIFSLADVPAKDFAESYGLAAPPAAKLVGLMGKEGTSDEAGADADELAVPTDISAEETTRLRAASHAKKNENKGLARLKAKILAEKVARVAARGGGESAGASAGAGGGAKQSTREDNEESLFVTKRKAGGADADDDADGTSLDVPAASLARLGDVERARIFAIERDTRLLGAGGAHVGADGLTPFERIARSKGTPAPLVDVNAAAIAFSSRVAERLARTATSDRERERSRVHEKHRAARQRDDSEGGADDAGPRLGTTNDSSDDDDDESDDDESDGNRGEDFKQAAPAPIVADKKSKRARQGESAGDADDNAPASKRLASLEAAALKALGKAR